MVVATLAHSGCCALEFVPWLIALVKGRYPEPLGRSTEAVLHAVISYTAYFLVLTDGYPRALWNDPRNPGRSYPRRSAGQTDALCARLVKLNEMGPFQGPLLFAARARRGAYRPGVMRVIWVARRRSGALSARPCWNGPHHRAPRRGNG